MYPEYPFMNIPRFTKNNVKETKQLTKITMQFQSFPGIAHILLKFYTWNITNINFYSIMVFVIFRDITNTINTKLYIALLKSVHS